MVAKAKRILQYLVSQTFQHPSSSRNRDHCIALFSTLAKLQKWAKKRWPSGINPSNLHAQGQPMAPTPLPSKHEFLQWQLGIRTQAIGTLFRAVKAARPLDVAEAHLLAEHWQVSGPSPVH